MLCCVVLLHSQERGLLCGAEVVAVGALLAALSRTSLFPRRLGFMGWEQIKEFAVAGSAVFARTLVLQVRTSSSDRIGLVYYYNRNG